MSFFINCSTVRIEVGLGFGLWLVLVLICSIRTANRLSHVVSIDYKTWCGALSGRPLPVVMDPPFNQNQTTQGSQPFCAKILISQIHFCYHYDSDRVSCFTVMYYFQHLITSNKLTWPLYLFINCVIILCMLLISSFYCMTLCINAVIAVTRCPSVCVTLAYCIQRLQISSNFFRGLVASSL